MTVSCLHASFRTTRELSKLMMMTTPLIVSSDESGPAPRPRIELRAPLAGVCLPASPPRRLELSKFADVDPCGVCAAGVVMRTVMTSSYRPSIACRIFHEHAKTRLRPMGWPSRNGRFPRSEKRSGPGWGLSFKRKPRACRGFSRRELVFACRVLALDPVARALGAIRRVLALRYNAFEAPLASMANTVGPSASMRSLKH